MLAAVISSLGSDRWLPNLGLRTLRPRTDRDTTALDRHSKSLRGSRPERPETKIRFFAEKTYDVKTGLGDPSTLLKGHQQKRYLAAAGRDSSLLVHDKNSIYSRRPPVLTP